VVWLAVAGILGVGAAAVWAAARQGRAFWWRYLLAGAAGWLAAQAVKGLVALPVVVAVPGAALRWWFVGLSALLPGVIEELGKYVPLRLLRVERRGSALALGLGAGAVEAVTVVAGLAAAGHGETAAGALLAVWERFWAVAFHAGTAAIDGYAVVSRRARWLAAAMALHTAVDLAAGWYDHGRAVGAPPAALRAPLAVAELGVAALAVVAWRLARRLWAARSPGAA
jgi:uncharacterized membrane protein YhfC